MDMKKILQAMDGVNAKAEVNSSDMKKFLTIVEGKDTKTNRLTTAESMAVNHYTEQKKPITTPVLNVQEGAKPSMIGKYFKTVEQELKEAAERPNEQATQLAKRVINRIDEMDKSQTPPGRDGGDSDSSKKQIHLGPKHMMKAKDVVKQGVKTLDKSFSKSKKDVKEAEGEPEGVAHLTKELLQHIVQQSGKEGAHAVVKSLTWGDGAAKELLHLIINDLKDDIEGMDEGLKDPKDNPCWKGYHPVGTKKKAGRTVPNCVPTSEAANAAQQAAIAIAKKKAGKK